MSVASTDLAQLRRWIRDGDSGAFDDLVRRYGGMVFGTCSRILHDAAQAEDVTQECFLKLAQSAAAVNSNVPGWLHRTATNLSLNRLKENARRARRESVYADAAPRLIEPSWDDIQPLVDEAINALPDKLRYPIVRHFLDGRTHRDVADEFGLTQSQVNYRIKRGVEKIRETLGHKGIVVGTAALTAHLAELSGVQATAALFAALGEIALAGHAATSASAAATASAFAAGGWPPIAVGAMMLLVAAAALIGDRDAAPAHASGTEQAAATSADSDRAEPLRDNVLLAQASSPVTISNAAASGAFAQARPRESATSGPGRIRGTAHLDPIGRSTYNPPLPADGYVQASLVSWRPYEDPPTDRLVLMATVSEHNEFEFENLPLGVYLVRVVGEGRTSVNSVALTATEPSKFVSVGHAHTIAPVIGRVTDTDGKPIEGVSVMTAAWETPDVEFTNEWQYVAGSETKSKANGGFVFDYTGAGPRAPARYRALARKEGYAPLVSEWFPGGTQDLTLVMSRGVDLAGSVVDQGSGKPVSGQRLRIETEVKWDRREFVTGPDGSFRLSNLGPYEYRIETEGSDRIIESESSVLDLTGGGSPDDLRLEAVEGGAIAGRIYDPVTDTGFANVGVHLYDPDDNIRRDFYIGYNVWQSDRATRTDSTGKFSFAGLPSGRYEIERENIAGLSMQVASGSEPRRQTVEVHAGKTASPEFVVTVGERITGRVADQNGRPLTDIAVMAGDRPSAWAAVMYDPTRENYAVTDPRGVFWLSGFRNGQTVYLLAESDKPMYSSRSVAAHPAGPFKIGEITEPIVITMQPESRISATIVDSRGVPIPDARLHAEVTEGSDTRYVHFRATDPDGRATVDKLVDGEYSLWVDLPGQGARRTSRLARVTVGVGEHVEAPRIVVPDADGLVFAGRVTDTSGRPVSGAEVTLNSVSGRTSDDGSFRIGGVEDDAGFLQVTHPDYTAYRVNQFVPTRAPMSIQLRGKGSLVADVLRNGRPVEKFRVVYLEDTRFPAYTNRTLIGMERLGGGIDGSNGAFSYRVPEGDCTIIVFAEDCAPSLQVVTGVVENQTLRLPPFNLVDGGVLAGTVLRADGKPAAGCEVSPDQTQSPGALRTDSRGEFQLAGLPTGTFTLWLTAPDGPAQEFEVTVSAGQTHRQTFQLHGGNSVSGVATLGGRPVAGAKVRVELVDDMNDRRGTRREILTDSRGRYSIENLNDGTVRVQVEIGEEPNQRGVIRAVEVWGGGAYTLDLHAAAGTARVQGKLTDSSGRPLSGRIELQIVDPNKLATITNTRAIEGEALAWDVHGSYDITGLPAGMCLIQFEATGAEDLNIVAMKMEGTELRDGETSEKDFVMEKR